jgi:hypothetical protein
MKYFTSALLVFISINATAQTCGNKGHQHYLDTKSFENNQRSDTLDVLDYKIFLDFTAMGSQLISGSSRVLFQSKMNNIDGISLDLLELNVDSVKRGNDHLTYSYNDTLIRVQFLVPLQQNDVDSVTIYYSGSPVTDPSGFGGFYFQGNYAYNLGVGFSADPHNYGRTWHPCFDNFVERATYEITVLSPSNNKSYSMGVITYEEITANNENLRTWRLEDPIPSYLACVAVSDYTHVNQTYASNLNGNQIPVMLISRAADTTNFKNSFANLFGSMDAFEENYGPYVWDKVGFVAVPFNGGAMEHATCIAYPLITLNGNLQYETLMAHELAHHWWGDLVTCRTSGDMWINEGIASYSEALFLEHVYGYTNYLNELKGVHRDVIQRAHFNDEAFYALSGVPHSATYGTHSYSKGSTVMHNMRSYMGDIHFFNGLKAIQTNWAFRDIDAPDFRDELEAATGLDMHPFFENWIFNPGFSGFVIDSIQTTPTGGNYDVKLFIQQKLFEAPHFFQQVPIEVTFVDNNLNEVTQTIVVDGQYSEITLSSSFIPAMTYLNKNDKLLNAVTGETVKLGAAATTNNTYAYYRQTTTNITDTVLMRIEHHRMAPDPFQTSEMNHMYVISPDRYWTIDGIWDEQVVSEGRFAFDARPIAAGNLDIGLLIDHGSVVFHEDSIVLLWRPNAGEEWSVYPEYVLNTQGSATDRSGRIDATNIQKGQYTFGFKKSSLGISKQGLPDYITIYPNPILNEIRIDLTQTFPEGITIYLYDAMGRIISTHQTKDKTILIPAEQITAGSYQVHIFSGARFIGQKTIIK